MTASTTPAAISSWTAKTSCGLAVEALRPELKAAGDVGQLRGDAKPVARRPHAALEDVAHGERAGDRGQVRSRPAARGRPRSATRRGFPSTRDERVHDLLGHPLAEVLLVLRGAHVGERQHRDRDGGLAARPLAVPARAAISSPALRQPSIMRSTYSGSHHFSISLRTVAAKSGRSLSRSCTAFAAASRSPSCP